MGVLLLSFVRVAEQGATLLYNLSPAGGMVAQQTDNVNGSGRSGGTVEQGTGGIAFREVSSRWNRAERDLD